MTNWASSPRGGTPSPGNARAAMASGRTTTCASVRGRCSPDPPERGTRVQRLEASGLPPLRFHDRHHTAATLLLRADGRVLTAQRRLGHRDPGTRTRLYGDVLPGGQRAEADAGRAPADTAPPARGAASATGGPGGPRPNER